jgi:hypothetical protein
MTVTTILDTTISDTGTVVSFSEADKRTPYGVVISMDVGSGDTLTLYTKVGTQAYIINEAFTADGTKTFIALPDSIRIDRTTDGGTADSTVVCSQID